MATRVRTRSRDERGVALPSPVVLLSIVAVAMAALAYLFTQGGAPAEREVAIVSRDQTPSASPSQEPEQARETREPEPKPEKKKAPPVQRGETFVVVFNNSGITGLAGQVGGQVATAGWQVVGTDNWYGSVPATTVYYPPQLERAGKQLALDLGVDRTLPAVEGMGGDRLTVILTAPLA